MSAQRHLKVGEKIPDFWTRDIDGNEVDSRTITGNTLLVFLRYAGCPWCNLAIYRLSHEYKLLKKSGCEVIAFIQSSESNIEQNVLQRQDKPLPFPIVSDQQQDIYKLFGVTPNAAKTVKYAVNNASHWIDAVFKKDFKQANMDGEFFMVPAYFLVDKNSIIKIANYEASFYDDSVLTPIYEQLTFGDA